MPKKSNKYIDCGNYYKIELYYPFTYVVCDYAFISKCDFELARTMFWRKTEYGYARGNDTKTGREVLLHKFITNTNESVVIDHINKNKLDCRRNNLRIANKQVNSLNRNVAANSSTKHTGVSFDQKRNKYRAYGKLNGKQIWLGYYETLEDACDARKHFEQQSLNPIYQSCKGVDI